MKSCDFSVETMFSPYFKKKCFNPLIQSQFSMNKKFLNQHENNFLFKNGNIFIITSTDSDIRHIGLDKKAKHEWRDEACCFVRVAIFMISCKLTDTVPISRGGKILLYSLVLVDPYTQAYNQNKLWNSWYGSPTLH